MYRFRACQHRKRLHHPSQIQKERGSHALSTMTTNRLVVREVCGCEGLDGMGYSEISCPFYRRCPGLSAADAYRHYENPKYSGCSRSSPYCDQRNRRGEDATTVFLARYSDRPRLTFARASLTSLCHFSNAAKSRRFTTTNSSPPLTFFEIVAIFAVIQSHPTKNSNPNQTESSVAPPAGEPRLRREPPTVKPLQRF